MIRIDQVRPECRGRSGNEETVERSHCEIQQIVSCVSYGTRSKDRHAHRPAIDHEQECERRRRRGGPPTELIATTSSAGWCQGSFPSGLCLLLVADSFRGVAVHVRMHHGDEEDGRNWMYPGRRNGSRQDAADNQSDLHPVT